MESELRVVIRSKFGGNVNKSVEEKQALIVCSRYWFVIIASVALMTYEIVGSSLSIHHMASPCKQNVFLMML